MYGKLSIYYTNAHYYSKGQSRRFASPRLTLREIYVFSTTLQICYVFYTTFATPLGRVGNQTLHRIHGKLTTLQFPVWFMQPLSPTGTRDEGRGMPGLKRCKSKVWKMQPSPFEPRSRKYE